MNELLEIRREQKPAEASAPARQPGGPRRPWWLSSLRSYFLSPYLISDRLYPEKTLLTRFFPKVFFFSADFVLPTAIIPGILRKDTVYNVAKIRYNYRVCI